MSELERLKACPACGETKPVTEFYKDKRRRDGLYAMCKVCHQAKLKAWKKANPERRQAYDKRYRATHKESIRATQRAWEEANPDKVQARRQRQYEKRKANKHSLLRIASAPAAPVPQPVS